jgi:transposase
MKGYISAVVAPLIPKITRRRDGKGRPRVPARRVLDGVLWILWTGAPWKALTSEYPPYQTCHGRMQEWVSQRAIPL